MNSVSESNVHRELTKSLIDWIAFECLGGDNGAILSDTGNAIDGNMPPRIGAFVPDAYVPFASDHSIIIGEAKTAKDIDNRHSSNQVEAFIDYCEKYSDSLFVMAVPWHRVNFTRNMLRAIIKGKGYSNFQFTVIENLPG